MLERALYLAAVSRHGLQLQWLTAATPVDNPYCSSCKLTWWSWARQLPEMKARFLVAQYWGAHQRFFKGLCICFKIDKVVELCKAGEGRRRCCTPLWSSLLQL